MLIRAELNYLRMAPRKVRVVADVIRSKRVSEAERMLRFLDRRAAAPLTKLLRSAVANARHNFQINAPESMIVREIRVDGGPALKRSRPRARGVAFPIRKRTSHITLVLEATGVVPSKRKANRADIAMVKDVTVVEPVAMGEKPAGRETLRPTIAREAKAKVATKPTDFVRRMFRRKAI